MDEKSNLVMYLEIPTAEEAGLLQNQIEILQDACYAIGVSADDLINLTREIERLAHRCSLYRRQAEGKDNRKRG